VDRAWDF